MESINPNSKLVELVSKLSKYELYIILKESEEFINKIKKSDEKHSEKMKKN